jgi:MoxR-like ATPase
MVPYPNEAEEFEILNQFHNMGNADVVSVIEPVLRAETIINLRRQVKTMTIEEKLLQFIAKLTHQTRHHKSIYLGASPRASLAVMNAAKAIAAISGRDFVTPEDILEVVPPVLRHRIILSPDKEMEGITEDNVIRQIIQTMDIPR